MNDQTIKGVEALLLAAGAGADALAAVGAALRLDGMVPAPVAARLTGLSRTTVWRLCKRHGIRRIARERSTSLVDFAALAAAAASDTGTDKAAAAMRAARKGRAA